MPVVVQLFTRSTFDVQAVQVNTANIGEIAVWCGGTIHKSPKTLYIKLDIPGARSSVRTSAFPGDWILLSDQGFRVYTERALETNFTPKITPSVSEECRREAIRNLVLEVIKSNGTSDVETITDALLKAV